MTTTYHAEVARHLHRQGAGVIFGLVGDANLFLVDHWVREYGGRYVPAVHEASAVMMAAGQAKVTGDVAVATVTHGPGLTNTITALVECAKSSLPVVLVAGRTTDTRDDSPQHVDQRPMIEATGALFLRAERAEHAGQDVATAFTRARAEQRPVVLELPVDLAWAQTEPNDAVAAVADDVPQAEVDATAVDTALGVVLSARRPVILAGRGAIGARDTLLELARVLGAPVATTAQAKDLFVGHPADLGIFGSLSSAATQDVLADADCVIAFGASLTLETTARGDLVAGKSLVHCDRDAAMIGRRFTPTAAVVGDADDVAGEFVRLLTEAESEPTGFDRRAVDRLTRPPETTGGSRRPDTVDLVEFLAHLEEAVPDRTLVVDVGRFALHVLRHAHGSDVRGSMWAGAGFAAIGLGTPMAIGAAVARPDRPTVLVVGDGGFALGGLNELSTAIAEGLDLVCIVANDGSYGAEHIQFTGRGMDPALSMVTTPDFVALAEAMGATGVRVRSTQDFAALDAAMERRSGPVLVDVRLDPDRVASRG